MPNSPDILRLRNVNRSGLPNLVLDVRSDEEGRDLVERTGVPPEDLPLAVCPSGPVLRRPSDEDLAACLGVVPHIDPDKLFDVAVVGAGSAGLATAV